MASDKGIQRAIAAVAFASWTTIHAVPAANAVEIVCVKQYGTSQRLDPDRPPAEACTKALLRGAIEKGDFERFGGFLRANYRALGEVLLQSPGGDAEEAMKIGSLVRTYLISAAAPNLRNGGNSLKAYVGEKSTYEEICSGPACICASACALIWSGSVRRWGRVGLHRPRITDPQFRVLPSAEAMAVYSEVIREIARYLEKMELPRPLIDRMLSTSAADVHWVDAIADDFLDKESLQHPSSYIEWINAKCGSLTLEERKLEDQLSWKAKRRSVHALTAAESAELERIGDKSFRRGFCETVVINAEREIRLPPP